MYFVVEWSSNDVIFDHQSLLLNSSQGIKGRKLTTEFKQYLLSAEQMSYSDTARAQEGMDNKTFF